MEQSNPWAIDCQYFPRLASRSISPNEINISFVFQLHWSLFFLFHLQHLFNSAAFKARTKQRSRFRDKRADVMWEEGEDGASGWQARSSIGRIAMDTNDAFSCHVQWLNQLETGLFSLAVFIGKIQDSQHLFWAPVYKVNYRDFSLIFTSEWRPTERQACWIKTV